MYVFAKDKDKVDEGHSPNNQDTAHRIFADLRTHRPIRNWLVGGSLIFDPFGKILQRQNDIDGGKINLGDGRLECCFI